MVVQDTPEILRVKENQKNFSSVCLFYLFFNACSNNSMLIFLKNTLLLGLELANPYAVQWTTHMLEIRHMCYRGLIVYYTN